MTHYDRQGIPVPRAKPGDWRSYEFWFDTNLAVWCIAPADGPGGIVHADKLEWLEIDATSNGRKMLCQAELIVDGRTLQLDNATQVVSTRTAKLRVLRVYDQVVHMPVVAKMGAG